MAWGGGDGVAMEMSMEDRRRQEVA